MLIEILKRIIQFKSQNNANEVQHPMTYFITCSDSRINPHLITDSKSGDLVVTRNVGNILPVHTSESSTEASSIEYAINKFNVNEIIVCGHSQCGAMKNLHTPHLEETLPAVSAWLVQTKSQVAEPEQSNSSSLPRIIEENVVRQIKNLETYPAVIAKLSESKLNIQGWHYEIETGQVSIYDQSDKQFKPVEKLSIASGASKLIKGVQYFKNNTYLQKQSLFHSLSQGQRPKALLITCSDPQIVPADIVRSEPGDFFLIRNFGPFIPPYSSSPTSEAAAIEYALKALLIKNVIVCGHSNCSALDEPMNSDLERRSLLMQIENLKTHPVVAEALSQNELTIYAWFYDFSAGIIQTYDFIQNQYISLDDEVTKILASDEV